jgi:hypothetical protein
MNLNHPLMPFAMIFIGIPIIGLLTVLYCALTGTL